MNRDPTYMVILVRKSLFKYPEVAEFNKASLSILHDSLAPDSSSLCSRLGGRGSVRLYQGPAKMVFRSPNCGSFPHQN